MTNPDDADKEIHYDFTELTIEHDIIIDMYVEALDDDHIPAILRKQLMIVMCQLSEADLFIRPAADYEELTYEFFDQYVEYMIANEDLDDTISSVLNDDDKD